MVSLASLLRWRRHGWVGYLYPPFSDPLRMLFCIWPIQGRPKRSLSILMSVMSRLVSPRLPYRSPMVTCGLIAARPEAEALRTGPRCKLVVDSAAAPRLRDLRQQE